MSEEEKKPEEESSEEPKEEGKSFDSEAKEIDKSAKEIAKTIIAEMNAQKKESKEAKKKKEVIQDTKSEVKMVDREYKMYTKVNKATGDTENITLKKSEIDVLHKWFVALLDCDKKAAAEVATKLGPLVEGTPARGGFLVPVILANFLTDIMDDMAVIKSRSRVIDMAGMKTDQLDISGFATSPVVSWTNEAEDKSTTSMTFGQISLTPYKLAAIDSLSKELRDDSPFNVVQIYAEKLARVVATEEDRVFMVGTGAGQPTGIDTYALRNINAGGALGYNHINSLYWFLPQAYRQRAYWIMNSRTLAAIHNFVDTNGRPIIQPTGTLTEASLPGLKGRPILENNHATSDRIWFGDLQQYYIATKGPLEIDTSEEASIGDVNLWQRNLIGIRVEERIDAELEPTEAFVEIQNTGVS